MTHLCGKVLDFLSLLHGSKSTMSKPVCSSKQNLGAFFSLPAVTKECELEESHSCLQHCASAVAVVQPI